MVNEVLELVAGWLLNALLAGMGVLHYAVFYLRSRKVCTSPEARADDGIMRVCRREMFRYSSRGILKALFVIHCLLRAWIVFRLAEPPIHLEQWLDCMAITAILVWLSIDSYRARRYD